MNLLDRLSGFGAPGSRSKIDFAGLEARLNALKTENASEDMAALRANLGVMHLFAQSAAGEKISARLMLWARELLRAGERSLTLEEITESLTALDEKEMLRAEEIMNAPAALRMAAGEAFLSCAGEALRAAEARRQAEKWVYGTQTALRSDRDDAAFFAHALRLTAETGDGEKRAALIQRLTLIGRDEEECIRLTQEAESRCVVYLNNLVAAARAPEQADWDEVFSRVSFTERTLMRDPAGIYPRMDDESRAAVRREVAVIARRAFCAERMVASLAVDCAGEGEGVCDMLYTDAGRSRLMEAMGLPGARLPRMVPDPRGSRLLSALLLAFAAVMAGVFWGIDSPFSALAAIPAAWALARTVVQAIFLRLTPTRPLLKLDMEKVPRENATLVVIPALIPDARRARQLAGQLEALGALDENETVDYLLLGDFPDADEEEKPSDAEILAAARTEIARMNAAAGREKYLYLHRKRALQAADGVWMGRERKRGALSDLNRLILTGENRFSAAGECAGRMVRRYRYVLTVDADTEMLPGAAQKLIGAMAHPLNRRYGVIQPRMEYAAELMKNRFSRLMAGAGGADTYHSCAPNLYQDFCASGIYSGKGIYDVEKFFARTEEKIEDNTVLSHDLLEGLLADAAYAGDVMLFEGFPSSPAAYLKRQERWTRGDWMLVRYFFRPLPLGALGRLRIVDNLLRSLFEPSILAMLVLAVWERSAGVLIFAGAAVLLPVLISRLRGGKAALTRLLLLPAVSTVQQGALARGLYRALISHKKTLEWVTAADADEMTGGKNTAGIAQAILLIPAVIEPVWLLAALPLAAMFIFGRMALEALSRDKTEAQFTSREFGALLGVARDTWKYFEKTVPLGGSALPPDNLQIEPPLGAARRTSPTNIGMYFAACVAARELSFIDGEEMRARIRETVKAIQNLPTWRGLHYNWYDPETGEPLHPRYVSSVDCGNLMAALILARDALGGEDPDTEKAIGGLIADMDLCALYDEKRRLFRIGFDAENGRMSDSYYDLLASEARILSFVAMAEKGVPIRHWERLGRPCVRVRGGSALVSWSGTMFEYLMPAIFLPSAENSLLGMSARGAVNAQMHYAAGKGRPWGVSECAYRAFDQALNYQYRAFGVPSLALSGASEGDTVAPYASCLALAVEPSRAAENIRVLMENGFAGEYGLYEAVDYAADGIPEIVFSFMTHHQGMALCAICNALTGGRLSQLFMSPARERALTVLLNEKPFARPRLRAVKQNRDEEALAPRVTAGYGRRALRAETEEGHLLSGKESLVFLLPDGSGFLRRGEIYANLWHGDPARYRERIVPEIADETGIVSLSEALFDAGSAVYRGRSAGARYEVTLCVSPESGALMTRVVCEASAPVRAHARQAFEVALADENAMHAHPVFHDLFIACEKHAPGVWRFSRRRRAEEDTPLQLLHGCRGGDTGTETRFNIDYCQPREGVTPIKPCAVWETELNVRAGERSEAYFLINLVMPEDADDPIKLTAAEFDRALSLSRARARTLTSFLGISAASFRALNRDAVRAFTARRREQGEASPRVTGRELWHRGISGRKPLMALEICSIRQRETLKTLIARHEYYRSAQVSVTLIVLYAPVNDYLRPLSDMIERTICGSHLAGKRGVEGGVYVLKKDELSAEEITLIDCLNILAPLRKTKERPQEIAFAPMGQTLPEIERTAFNGIGGFRGAEYVIDLCPGKGTPLPWVNILANPSFGALVTETGGGFLWHENSRMRRLTPFDNNPLRPGWALKIGVETEAGLIPLTPGEETRGAYRVAHAPGETRFFCRAGGVEYETVWHVDAALPMLSVRVSMKNESGAEAVYQLRAEIDWLMGEDVRDRKFAAVRAENGFSFCFGRAGGVGFMTMDVPCDAEGGRVSAPITLKGGETTCCALLVGWAENAEEAKTMAAQFDARRSREETRAWWRARLSRVEIATGDEALDNMLNGFCKYQVLAARMFARTGFYQPGGAIGLRDQLQDALCVAYMDPAVARGHLLTCAAHQFRAGDGMHWWHAPFSGVRTRISDDMLFLPFVCAHYVRLTGDRSILEEKIAYLENETIPAGREDWYGEAHPSEDVDTLNGHCLRAFRHADRVGEHGLILMGAGDWNDGMNRVGSEGRGESVWLSMFLSYTAKAYAEFCAGEDRDYLLNLAERLRAAVEREGWDGKWYLRAIDDHGNRLGSAESRECQIDLISQAWAALNGQDEARVQMALASAEKMLVDRKMGLTRLLYPPFTGAEPNPGYISAYPAGVRENGGQYTHAACWLAAAYARRGEAQKAWEIFRMLLPIDRADTPEKIRRYRAEPYAVAADISAAPGASGAAGWTWYTGAAGWTVKVMLEEILGLDIRENKASLHALLPEGRREVGVTLRVGGAEYHLLSGDYADDTEAVALVDDGQSHTVRFSARNRA